MANVLIFGESAYIARSFAGYAKGAHNITAVSSRGAAWAGLPFARFDSVLYCAGAAHLPPGKAADRLYFEVNCDLAAAVAAKAKAEGVRQFVYLSSAAVFGRAAEIGPASPLKPEGPYGASKLKAEAALAALRGGGFAVCVVRPPMVYGRGCKGNFARLTRLALAAPLFPDIENRRSMIYIENLCHFLSGLVRSGEAGVFFPQNKDYVNTTELVRQIRRCRGKNTAVTRLFNPLITSLSKRIPELEKLFGDMVYHGEAREYVDYVGFEESVRRSVTIPTLGEK